MVPTKPGLRAFRYTLPTTPVATASVDIGHVGVRFELFLHGELDISVSRRAGADDRAVRACTLKALRAMAKGLMVSGSGSSSPTIGSAAGHAFAQSGYRFAEPNTMTFAGTCGISFAQRCDSGPVTVTGEARYALDVTAWPADGRAVESIGSGQAGAWFQRHEQELASIGVVVLVAVPISPSRLVAC
ncbi:MAG TPA: hypothetical protein VGR06_36610 [Actinophytocola sp.]|jgi:hypothetical protein|uniref:hypothetical protein n=1 Tax=Actinophytocola sp. TaxID=1872138 RepID=UPI002DFA917B|nr:hypothetical protein [Actinophytocola sp.]